MKQHSAINRAMSCLGVNVYGSVAGMHSSCSSTEAIRGDTSSPNALLSSWGASLLKVQACKVLAPNYRRGFR